MPYIKADRRAYFQAIVDLPLDQPGELNYCITELLLAYTMRQGLTYGRINDCLGALEGAKLEFYRRLVVPFENKKMVEHGDVYEVSDEE